MDVSDLGILAANYGFGGGSQISFQADSAQIFGTAMKTEEKPDDQPTSPAGCGLAGLSLMAVFLSMGLLLIKVEE